MPVYLKKPKDINYGETYKFLTMDIETGVDSEYNSALLGDPVYISWCDEGKGYGVKSNDLTHWLINYFLDIKYSGYILYAHNGFRFDFKRVDWIRIANLGFKADIINDNSGGIKSITLTRDDYTWIIRDSILLIPRSLADVTKKFAPEHMKIKRELSFDVSPFNPDDEKDVEYAIQDSIALYYAIRNVDNLLRENFNVSIHSCATAPSLAFKAFRLKIDEDEKFEGISFNVAHAARQSYHGGQTIAFQTKPFKDVVSLDANSMYSYVMINYPLPTGKVTRHTSISPDANVDRTLCLAVVNIPDGVFPLLKTSDIKGRVGNFNGVVTGWYWLFELEKQKELGGQYTVLESYEWEEETDVASRFVEICRLIRMSDYHGAVGELAKLLANSLYGKFAMRIPKTRIILSNDEVEDGIPYFDPLSHEIRSAVWEVDSGQSFRADMTHWASFITAKARMVLTHAIELVGFDNIIYCDTDSVFFERKYMNRMRSILGKQYGQFKLEKGTEEKGIHFQAFAPKAYLYQDEYNRLNIKNKGIPTRDMKKQDAYSRIGLPNESVEFISSHNLMQMIKRNASYGRKASRKMATTESTTNGNIINDKWIPIGCEIATLEQLRDHPESKYKTSSLLKKKYDILVQRMSKEG